MNDDTAKFDKLTITQAIVDHIKSKALFPEDVDYRWPLGTEAFLLYYGDENIVISNRRFWCGGIPRSLILDARTQWLHSNKPNPYSKAIE